MATTIDNPLSTATSGEPTRPPKRGWWATALGSLFRSLPTVAVLASLGGIAAWGHHTNWTMPKFSSLSGSDSTAASDWCADHNVPEAICINCQEATQKTKIKRHGWCRVHGVAECPFEHPETAQLAIPSEVTTERLATVKAALDLRPRQANNSRCKTHERRIQFASEEAAEKSGLDIAVATEERVVESIPASGEVRFDETRMAHLGSPLPGRVWRVEKRAGDTVRRGEVLLLVEAQELGRAKGEYLQALTDVKLKRSAVARLSRLTDGAVAGKQLSEAEASLEAAEIRLVTSQESLINLGLPVRAKDFSTLTPVAAGRRLKFLGIDELLAEELDPDTTSSNLLPIVSPIDGVVIERHAVVGEYVDTENRLISVADVGRLWVTVDVSQAEIDLVKPGQRLFFRPDGTRSELNGEVAWIDSQVDERTRTVKVRAEVEVPREERDARKWRSQAFGAGRIILREDPRAVVVPSEAVHWERCCHIVFVRDKDYLKPDAPKVFHVRKVRPGVRTELGTELLAGLLPGEIVATTGSDLLRVELLKSQLGKG